MSPNRYVERQRERLLRGRAGQALPLLLVTVGTLLAVLLSVLHLAMLQAETVRASNVADSASLSAATWEARGLNVIAALNDGVLQCLRVIRWICAVWAGLAVSAAFGVAVPAFVAYGKYARAAIRSYWRLALQLAEWADRVRRSTPWLALAEASSVLARHGAAAVLRPADPAGRHDGKGTLELHVAPGRAILLSGALSPLREAIGRIEKRGAGGAVSKALDAAMGAIRAGTPPSIRLLVPEEDLPRRQNVTVEGSVRCGRPTLPLSLLRAPAAHPCASRAEAYGGDATTPTWRSRLIPAGDAP